MSFDVKAFLERNGDPKDEVRRFAFPPNTKASYAYVFKKVSEVFPVLTHGNFSLYWKDGDGDLISVSTDEELTYALGFVCDAVLHIYVKELTATAGDIERGILPRKLLCEGCGGEIRDCRNQCCICPLCCFIYI